MNKHLFSIVLVLVCVVFAVAAYGGDFEKLAGLYESGTMPTGELIYDSSYWHGTSVYTRVGNSYPRMPGYLSIIPFIDPVLGNKIYSLAYNKTKIVYAEELEKLTNLAIGHTISTARLDENSQSLTFRIYGKDMEITGSDGLLIPVEMFVRKVVVNGIQGLVAKTICPMDTFGLCYISGWRFRKGETLIYWGLFNKLPHKP